MNLRHIIRDVLPFGLVESRREFYRQKAPKVGITNGTCVRSLNFNGTSITNTKRPTLPYLQIPLVDHCNLNCRSCGVFSPLSKPYYYEISEFKTDMKKLSEIFWNVFTICLLGGEPLLHPNLNEFIVLTREFFPIADLCLVTNGILLEEQSEIFWETCSVNKVVISISRYPINLNLEKLFCISDNYNVPIEIDLTVDSKKFFYGNINLDGNSNPKSAFTSCCSTRCTHLRSGKLSPCPFPASANIFNEYFGKNIAVQDEDVLDIHNVKDAKDIIDFLSKPPKICRFCSEKPLKYGEWSTTKKDIKEWARG